MRPPSYMRSVVDRNVVTRRMTMCNEGNCMQYGYIALREKTPDAAQCCPMTQCLPLCLTVSKKPQFVAFYH
jgi:hypothetical protein